MRIILLLCAWLAAGPAFAQNRMALVIGNDAYANVPQLALAVADATAVADALRQQGYETLTATDAGRRDMNRKISDFTARLQPGDTAVVYFAGHGVEIDGENYLLPADILVPGAGESDFVKSESIALSGLLDRVRATGARTVIAIIDACRNNPFATASGRSIGATRGLGRIAAPQGSFVIFSAGAGQLALDHLPGETGAANSVFTRALLKRLPQPGLELREMVADLRIEVRDMALSVQHAQVPAYYDELIGAFYFAPPANRPAAETQPGGDGADRMREDFDLAREIGTPAAWDIFLERHAARRGEYTYELALQLREGAAASEAGPSARDAAAPEPPAEDAPGQEAAPPAMAARSREDIIRATQAALNRANCAAGAADGIAGPRTRSAFARFIRESGADLAEGDLGLEAALKAVEAQTGPVCSTAAPPAPEPPRAVRGPTMAGSWSFSATCAFGLRVTGTVRLRETQPNFFRGEISDSLGQHGTAEMTLSGLAISGKSYFPAKTNTFSGQMAPDGLSYTTKGTSTCTVHGRKAG
ncbi:caspase family protein [Mangrovicoccus sp. HB161399]|uniref:caspase family protein n=1 Tax=Mangrovicoccus sp. HB161399 TaxID=2720392 RepID=UPI0015580C8E|nr:caspase family protein [Mangrovicoccus sp. HB161399]